MVKEEGFILSNKHPKAVFQEIAAGESSTKTIAKKHRLHHTMVENAVHDLQEVGLVTGNDNDLTLSEAGVKVFADLKSTEAL